MQIYKQKAAWSHARAVYTSLEICWPTNLARKVYTFISAASATPFSLPLEPSKQYTTIRNQTASFFR